MCVLETDQSLPVFLASGIVLGVGHREPDVRMLHSPGLGKEYLVGLLGVQYFSDAVLGTDNLLMRSQEGVHFLLAESMGLLLQVVLAAVLNVHVSSLPLEPLARGTLRTISLEEVSADKVLVARLANLVLATTVAVELKDLDVLAVMLDVGQVTHPAGSRSRETGAARFCFVFSIAI